MEGVVLSTGDIKREYEIVDIIHAAISIRSWWVTAGAKETMKFFPEVNEKLRTIAKNRGCNGVIWIDYDITRGEAGGAGARTTTIIVAYGTGVRFK